MTETSSDRITDFVERLYRLERADLARLKRGLTRNRFETMALFYRLLPPTVMPYHEEMYFLIATLFPINHEGKGKGNFGETLRRAKTKVNRKGLDRRMVALLDADNQQLEFRLRQAIRYLQSRHVPVAWELLLKDLLNWNDPKRFVQEAWARAYFRDEASATKP